MIFFLSLLASHIHSPPPPHSLPPHPPSLIKYIARDTKSRSWSLRGDDATLLTSHDDARCCRVALLRLARVCLSASRRAANRFGRRRVRSPLSRVTGDAVPRECPSPRHQIHPTHVALRQRSSERDPEGGLARLYARSRQNVARECAVSSSASRAAGFPPKLLSALGRRCRIRAKTRPSAVFEGPRPDSPPRFRSPDRERRLFYTRFSAFSGFFRDGCDASREGTRKMR